MGILEISFYGILIGYIKINFCYIMCYKICLINFVYLNIYK